MTWGIKKIAAVCAFGAAMGVTAASASPLYIGYSLNGGSITQVATTLAGDANFIGNVGGAGVNHTNGVHLNLGISGDPTLTDGLFSSVIATRVAGSTGSVAVKLYFSQTNLTDYLTSVTSGWANNSGQGGVNVTETTYLQACTSVACNGSNIFATTNQIGTVANLAPGAGSPNVTTAFPLAPGVEYNETAVFAFTLPASGAGNKGNLNANITLQGTTPVPEPLTLSLFGAGIAGVAAARRRKKAA